MGIFDKLFGRKHKDSEVKDVGIEKEGVSERNLAKILSNVKDLVFEQGRFKEAAKILEEATELYPNSAPVQFSLGVTYLKIGGEYKDEDAARPWALKSSEAFKKAVDLANRYGGLNDKQIAKARESVESIERAELQFKERKTPSMPEEKKGKYCALCGKKLLEQAPRPLGPGVDFANAVEQIGVMLRRSAYVCEKCGATVCTGCMPAPHAKSTPDWKNYPNCPKCG